MTILCDHYDDNMPTVEIMGYKEQGWILDEAVLRSGDRIKQRDGNVFIGCKCGQLKKKKKTLWP